MDGKVLIDLRKKAAGRLHSKQVNDYDKAHAGRSGHFFISIQLDRHLHNTELLVFYRCENHKSWRS